MVSRGGFPMIRFFSPPVTAALMWTPLTANQVTFLSMAAGLAGAWMMSLGTWETGIGGAVLFFVCYLLDNCDGEIARRKGQTSEFGDRFDSFVDWIVHTAFFAGLGVGEAARTGHQVWLWLGLIASAGGTINYGVGLYLRRRETKDGNAPAEHVDKGEEEFTGLWDFALFVFRELMRADFCFIILALAVFDVSWVLLPAGAIGAQVYWITQPFAGHHKV